MIVSEFESAAWQGGLLIWISGEAELDAVRVSDDQAVSKHYDLTGLDDLEVLLGELDALLTSGRVPDAAVVHQHPFCQIPAIAGQHGAIVPRSGR
ncbi:MULTISPECIES: hypothetical protein [unclassified Actinoplanes]|uniref:hypothetical protein n=1 Tax=unclassified Actinoplanes TaxID=2626549 RepID=UPI0002D81EF8|nr:MULTISPECIES: hypothetical protein [unclassified Actinoplanes]